MLTTLLFHELNSVHMEQALVKCRFAFFLIFKYL